MPNEDVPVDTTVDPDIAPPQRTRARARRTAPPEPVVEDRIIVGELIEAEEEEDPDERLTLTLEERTNFATLVNVGKRFKTINVADHQVTIKTLKASDEMRIGLYTKPYLDTQGFARAYQVAVSAAGLVEIQNQELWKSLKEVTDPDEIFAKNVAALEDFYPIVITQIYQAVMDLEREFAELAIKLGKLGDPAKK